MTRRAMNGSTEIVTLRKNHLEAGQDFHTRLTHNIVQSHVSLNLKAAVERKKAVQAIDVHRE